MEVILDFDATLPDDDDFAVVVNGDNENEPKKSHKLDVNLRCSLPHVNR